MAIKKVCVYCASSQNIDKVYFDSAKTLGKLFTDNNIECKIGRAHV